MYKYTGVITYAEYSQYAGGDAQSNEKLRKCLHEVMHHDAGKHFSQDIMYYIGCDLWGYKCEYSFLPYWQCSIHKLPATGHPLLIAFVEAGVYSLPCHNYRQCGHWIFFRQAEFEINENMESKWKALGWHKGGKRKYFTCPDCIRDEDTSSSGAVRGREMVTMKVS